MTVSGASGKKRKSTASKSRNRGGKVGSGVAVHGGRGTATGTPEKESHGFVDNVDGTDIVNIGEKFGQQNSDLVYVPGQQAIGGPFSSPGNRANLSSELKKAQKIIEEQEAVSENW